MLTPRLLRDVAIPIERPLSTFTAPAQTAWRFPRQQRSIIWCSGVTAMHTCQCNV